VRELVPQANLLTSDKVAAIFVRPPGKPAGHPQGGQFSGRKPHPDLVDVDLVTVET
jgi:hypothetical protein